MTRKNHKRGLPQRHRHPVDRELLRAINAERPKPFGVRRLLDEESQLTLMDLFASMIDDRELPNVFVPRKRLHVTLMPESRVSRELYRGLVVGYEFGKKAKAIKSGLAQVHPEKIEADLGDSGIFRRRHVGYKILSPDLEREHRQTQIMMARAGIKGAFRDTPPLHVTLGEIGVKKLSLPVREAIMESLDEFKPIMDAVVLKEVDFYPDPET